MSNQSTPMSRKNLSIQGSNHGSFRSNGGPSPSNRQWKKLLLDTTQGDEDFLPEDFEDVHCEIQATGYHLTSVLMNPKETLLDNIFDEFASEQSLPLEYSSPLANSFGGGGSIFTPSTHSSMHSSSAAATSGNTSVSSRGGGVLMFSLTQNETEQLNRFLRRMHQVFKIYLGAHGNEILNRINSKQNIHNAALKQVISPSKAKKMYVEELSMCYLHVPEVFFRPDFTLVKQEIFNQAILISTGHQQQQQSELQAQDKLSHYLDLVEVALLRQIWSRSPAFFRALDDLKGLQYNVHEAIKQLKHVRASLQTINHDSTQQALLIPTMATRQRNCSTVQVTLEYLHQWIQGRMAILALLEVEDYFSAQELLFTIKKIYSEHLTGVDCIHNLSQQMSGIEVGVSEVLCNQFVTVGIQWIETATPTITVQTTSKAGNISAMSDFDILDRRGERELNIMSEQRSLCQRLVHSLVISETLLHALNIYKNRLIDGLKLIIRTCITEYISSFDPGMDDSGSGGWEELTDPTMGSMEASLPYIQRIRDMSADNFLSCLSMCFEHILTSLKKAEGFHNYLSQQLTGAHINKSQANAVANEEEDEDFHFTSSLSQQSQQQLPESQATEANVIATAVQNLQQEERDKLISFSKACLLYACEMMQKAVAQLINYRKDINAKFDPFKMKFMWEISLNFVLALEQYSTATASIVRQCLLLQTRAFLDYLHESYKNRLVSTLDNERWIQCDVAADRQREIDRLSSGKAFLTASSSNSSSQSNYSNNNLSSAAATAAVNVDANGMMKKKDKEAHPAIVDHAEYRVVWSVLLLTEIVMSYLDVAFHFSPVTSEVIAKIVEQIRLFNNRTKQLVLGAQAIQSAARLKSISAKHLAITGRSLGLFIALLPHIRAALLAQIPAKHHMLLTELDRVSQDLFEHHAQIVAKFVSIVGDTIEASAVKLRQVDWDRLNGACEYFEEMSRNVSTLHKVLLAILPPEQIQDVFFRIFGLLNRRIPAHFEEIYPSTPVGRQRICDELTHLVSTLSRLKQVDSAVLTQLEDTFRKKYIQA